MRVRTQARIDLIYALRQKKMNLSELEKELMAGFPKSIQKAFKKHLKEVEKEKT